MVYPSTVNEKARQNENNEKYVIYSSPVHVVFEGLPQCKPLLFLNIQMDIKWPVIGIIVKGIIGIIRLPTILYNPIGLPSISTIAISFHPLESTTNAVDLKRGQYAVHHNVSCSHEVA